ncbi:MAG: hypothetical protein EOO41_02765 [Methanobacteriota archaeon]|nr:MAG: hypothetical protein EOO41_02765 [Euryarchaeota archaeon]
MAQNIAARAAAASAVPSEPLSPPSNITTVTPRPADGGSVTSPIPNIPPLARGRSARDAFGSDERVPDSAAAVLQAFVSGAQCAESLLRAMSTADDAAPPQDIASVQDGANAGEAPLLTSPRSTATGWWEVMGDDGSGSATAWQPHVVVDFSSACAPHRESLDRAAPTVATEIATRVQAGEPVTYHVPLNVTDAIALRVVTYGALSARSVNTAAGSAAPPTRAPPLLHAVQFEREYVEHDADGSLTLRSARSSASVQLGWARVSEAAHTAAAASVSSPRSGGALMSPKQAAPMLPRNLLPPMLTSPTALASPEHAPTHAAAVPYGARSPSAQDDAHGSALLSTVREARSAFSTIALLQACSAIFSRWQGGAVRECAPQYEAAGADSESLLVDGDVSTSVKTSLTNLFTDLARLRCALLRQLVHTAYRFCPLDSVPCVLKCAPAHADFVSFSEEDSFSTYTAHGKHARHCELSASWCTRSASCACSPTEARECKYDSFVRGC